MPRTTFEGPLLALSLLCACNSSGAGNADGGSGSGGGPPPGVTLPPDMQAPGAYSGPTGTIAFVRGAELHLVEPDGSGDHVVFRAPRPDLPFTLGTPSWRPDGAEIAFTSDHEEATSLLQRDLYTVRPDGSGLRKITNTPQHANLGVFQKGKVTVTVTNATADSGPYFLYVAGASEPQQVSIPIGGSVTITFADVADFGDVAQQAVAINGGTRWTGAAAADVKAGQTVNAGTLSLTRAGGIANHGAESPMWRADGSTLAFFDNPTCIVEQISASPPLSNPFAPVLDPKVFGSPCAIDRSPLRAQADQLLVADSAGYSDRGETVLYRVTEGQAATRTQLALVGDYARVIDLRWLPDGTGFVVSRWGGLLETSVNLYRYGFGGGAPQQLTHFDSPYTRFFSVARDGRIALEAVSALDGPADLYVLGTDGSVKLVARNAAAPAWNPTR